MSEARRSSGLIAKAAVMLKQSKRDANLNGQKVFLVSIAD